MCRAAASYADLHQHLRTGRAVRRPRRSTDAGPSGKIPDMMLISEGQPRSPTGPYPANGRSRFELPVGDRHAGGTADPILDARASARRQPRCDPQSTRP